VKRNPNRSKTINKRTFIITAVLIGCLLMVLVVKWHIAPALSVKLLGLKEGGYAIFGVTNNDTHEVRFQTLAVEYKITTNWLSFSPTNWLPFEGLAWQPGTGRTIDVARPDEIPSSAAWRIRFICYRDDETDIGSGPRASWANQLNGLARKWWKTNTLMFKSPRTAVTPEIPAETER